MPAIPQTRMGHHHPLPLPKAPHLPPFPSFDVCYSHCQGEALGQFSDRTRTIQSTQIVRGTYAFFLPLLAFVLAVWASSILANSGSRSFCSVGQDVGRQHDDTKVGTKSTRDATWDTREMRGQRTLIVRKCSKSSV